MELHRGLVIFGAIYVAFFNYGILQAYGALFTATLNKFNEGRSKTSLIFSLLAGTSLGAGVVAGYLIRRFSLRVVSTIGSVLLPLGFIASYFATSVTFLLISIGIVSGLGISFAYVSAVVVLGTVISEKHKTSALSIQNVACGVPGIVVPYLFAWLTKTYTLSGTFLIYGGILLNNMAASILFSGVSLNKTNKKGLRKSEIVETNNDGYTNKVFDMKSDPVTTEEPAHKNGDVAPNSGDQDGVAVTEKIPEVDNHGGQASRVTTYVLYAIGETLAMTTVIGILALYQDIGIFRGLSAEQTLTCISAYNIASTVSRFFPMIFQKVSENPFVSPIAAAFSGALGQLLLLITSNYYVVVIGYVMSGVADGGTSASISVIIYKILSQKAQTMGFGFVLTLMGVVGSASGPVYGAIIDQTKSYNLVLSITSGSFAIGGVLFLLCFISYRGVCCKRTKKGSYRPQQLT